MGVTLDRYSAWYQNYTLITKLMGHAQLELVVVVGLCYLEYLQPFQPPKLNSTMLESAHTKHLDWPLLK